MSNHIKKRNHYIPKTYLKKFLNADNRLFVYKKGEDFFNDKISKGDRLLTVHGEEGLDAIGVKNYLYIPEGKFNEDKNIFEDFFSDKFESPYNDFIKYTEANFTDVKKILNKYHAYIINLIASMMVRTLHYKIELEDIYKTTFQISEQFNLRRKSHLDELKKVITDKFPDLNNEEVEETVRDYTNMMNEGKFGVKLPRNLFIKKMIKDMKFHSNLISDMTIQILKNDKKSFFITSDNPAVYFVPQGKEYFPYSSKSLGGPYTELYFPLSKSLCLILSRYKIEVLSGIPTSLINKKVIRNINETIAYNSRNFIYSSYQANFLDKFIKEKISYPYKFSIS